LGGETVFENLCLACPSCNRYKADRQNIIDPVTAQTVPLFHPQLQVWKEHFTWNEDANEIVGRTVIVWFGALRCRRAHPTRSAIALIAFPKLIAQRSDAIG
jgi:hypothetical protein